MIIETVITKNMSMLDEMSTSDVKSAVVVFISRSAILLRPFGKDFLTEVQQTNVWYLFNPLT